MHVVLALLTAVLSKIASDLSIARRVYMYVPYKHILDFSGELLLAALPPKLLELEPFRNWR